MPVHPTREARKVNSFKKARLVFNKVNTLFMTFACVILIAITVAISLETIARYAFNHTWVGLFEITEYSLVWMTFLATTWLLQKNGHIRMDMLYNVLSKRHGIMLGIASYILCIMPLTTGIWYTAKVTLDDYQRNFISFQTAMYWPKWPIEIIIPIGLTMFLIQILIKIFEKVSELAELNRDKPTVSDSASGD